MKSSQEPISQTYPTSFFQVFAEAFKFFRMNYLKILQLALIYMLIGVPGSYYFEGTLGMKTDEWGLMTPEMGQIGKLLLPLGFIVFAGGMIILLITFFLLQKTENQKLKVLEIYHKAFKHLFHFLIIMILIGISFIGGSILLIIPGLIFLTWFIFAPLAYIIEGKTGYQALEDSRLKVKGHFVSVVLTLIMMLLIFIIPNASS